MRAELAFEFSLLPDYSATRENLELELSLDVKHVFQINHYCFFALRIEIILGPHLPKSSGHFEEIRQEFGRHRLSIVFYFGRFQPYLSVSLFSHCAPDDGEAIPRLCQKQCWNDAGTRPKRCESDAKMIYFFAGCCFRSLLGFCLAAAKTAKPIYQHMGQK